VELHGGALGRALACALLVVALAVPAAGRAQGVAPPTRAALLQQARALSAAGKAEEAYLLLAAHEDDYIGEIEFDYAIGRAALDSGRPARATLAFSRVLAQEPRHAGALIDMGRAYLALGNREQARAVFEGLLALNPPPPIRDLLSLYMAQASGGGERRTFVSGFLAASAGYDSNVNAAAAQARIFVPLFGAEVELASRNVRKRDSYAMLGAGIDVTHELDQRYALIGGADALGRHNASEEQFDIDAAAARLGIARIWDGYFARAQLVTARSNLGGSGNRNMNALALDVSENPGAVQWSGFLQAGRFRYLPVEQKIFDADFLSLGVGLRRTWSSGTVLSGTVYAGKENDIGGNPGGDRRLAGLLLGLEQPLADKLTLLASAGAQEARYELTDPSFLVTRKDRRWDAEIALRYQFDASLSVKFGVLATRVDSNIPIYSYPREDIGITLRRDFR
jgi:tetratricopeptide (TPR) repeat protein